MTEVTFAVKKLKKIEEIHFLVKMLTGLLVGRFHLINIFTVGVEQL